MSRTTERQQPGMARRTDLWIVMASRDAVDRAMERLHTDNPAGYHRDRPSLGVCPYDQRCPFMKKTAVAPR